MYIAITLSVAMTLAQLPDGRRGPNWIFESSSYPGIPKVEWLRHQLERYTAIKPTFVHLIIYHDRDLERMLFTRSYVASTVAIHQIRTNGQADLNAAEGLSIESGAAIRVREGQRVRKLLIRGKDPFILSLEPLSEVVYLGHAYGKAIVFVRTRSDMTGVAGSEIDRIVQQKFGESTVYIRNDVCFVGIVTYPSINPFVGPMEKGTCEQYWKSRAIWCGTRLGSQDRKCEVEDWEK